MSYAPPPNLWEYPSLLYRTKSFELTRYYIEHPVVHGFLNIASIPVSILSAVPDKLPPDVVVADDDRYIVGTTDIVSFVEPGGNNPRKICQNQKVAFLAPSAALSMFFTGT